MAITAVTVEPQSDAAGAATPWDWGFTPGTNFNSFDRINMTYAAGVDLSGVTTGSNFSPPGVAGTTLGPEWLADTFVYQVDRVGQVVTWFLYSPNADPLLASGNPGTWTQDGVVNPGAGTYPAGDFSVSTNSESAVSPSADVVIVGSALVPTADNDGASDIGATTATLNGTVSSRGATTTVEFEYGTDPTLSSGTTTVAADQSPLGPSAADAAVSVDLTGLANERLYYRINATNSEGTTQSSILPFSPATTRYWVGGTGDFNAAANWSATSGGTGGAGAPTATTNARFDANSFDGAGQVVTIDADAEFLSMDWTGATGTPELDFGTDLHVTAWGSLTLIAAMTLSGALNETEGWTWNSEPPLASGSPTANTINLAGHTLPLTNENPVSTVGMPFYGAGSWTLAADFVQPATHLYFYDSGSFDADGHDVECRVIQTSPGNTVDLSGITITVHDFLLISQGTVITTGTALVTAPDIDYVGISLKVSGQTFASLYAHKEFGVGPVGFIGTQGMLTIVGTATLEEGGSYDTSDLLTVGGLAVDGTDLAALTGALVATAQISADYLDLTDCPVTGITPAYAGVHSTDNGGNTNWLFEAYPSTTHLPGVPSIPSIASIGGI